MRIRTKLAFLELVLIVGFLITLGVILFFTNSIIKLKDFELHSNTVMSSLKQMNSETQALLTTQEPLIELSVEWTQMITDFEQELNTLSDFSAGRVLTKDQQSQLYQTTGWWDQIYQWYYVPAIDHLQKMRKGPSGEAIGSNGILQTLLKLQTIQREPPEYFGELVTMQNYQALMLEETVTFSDRLTNLTMTIQEQINKNIQYSTRLVISLLIATLLITVFISARFASLLNTRIHQVEEAIRNIARGDFSTELKINSRDEFEILSHNYNQFKNQLQDKLNSVLDFMVSINDSLAEGPEMKRIIKLIAAAAVHNTGADGAAVYLVDEQGTTLIPHAFDGPFSPPFPVPKPQSATQKQALAYAAETPIPLGSHVIGRSVETAEPVFIRSLENSGNGNIDFRREPGEPLFINSLIITPLMISNRLLGAIVITKQKDGEQFTDLDFTHMQTFADYAALTIDNIFNYEELLEKREMHREIEIAADIQRDLLPSTLPDIPGAELAAFSRAAKGISGDYYDVFHIDKNKLGIVICDVVGKGVPASLLMVMIRTIIRMVSAPQRTPDEMLTLLNRGIIGRIGTDRFATMSIFSYDSASREVIYSNAAHPPLLLYKSSEDQFLEVDTPGLPIGIEQKEQYHLKRFKADKGDILIMFTDGITETRSPDGREYSNELLKKNIRQAKSKSAQAISKMVETEIDRFKENAVQHDDQTLVLLKIDD